MNLIDLLCSTVTISIPYIMAALGGLISERGGVINIALEGFLLTGAFFAVLGNHLFGSFCAGLLLAGISGILISSIHAYLSINLGANQIISGVSINLFAVGFTKFLLKIFFNSSSNSSRVEGFSRLGISTFRIADVFIDNPFVIFAFLAVFAVHYFLFSTVPGLRIRACGENAGAAISLGIKVKLYRWLAVLLSGVLCALGGAWLALEQHQFTDGMSGGRGFIAIAAIIFGKWNPKRALAGCLIFALAEALQIGLQNIGTVVPAQFIQMLPFVLTILALTGFVGRGKAPLDLGR